MDLPTLKPSEGFQPAFLFNTLQSCHKSPIFVFLVVDLGVRRLIDLPPVAV
ncbi:MAG: hypothetical protein JRI36_04585 [Deltaproteobacteria bacterium]|nr:hypothetical protein [Deltaproteobacteria bacterium]